MAMKGIETIKFPSQAQSRKWAYEPAVASQVIYPKTLHRINTMEKNRRSVPSLRRFRLKSGGIPWVCLYVPYAPYAAIPETVLRISSYGMIDVVGTGVGNGMRARAASRPARTN
jgi:hypothetical protein